MGLTKSSTGAKAISGFEIKKQTSGDKIIALAGNPNVGKSTVFNALTGLNQHTGNWAGKTVTNALGRCETNKNSYIMVDIPGTYSLMAHSAEEEVARNFICFANPDAVVVVCDATCLERNLNLVLQTMEISSKVIVCVNLLDEAKRKNIKIDLSALEEKLNVPVVGVTARKKKTLKKLTDAMDSMEDYKRKETLNLKYPDILEQAISMLEPIIKAETDGKISSRWLALKLLDNDESLINEINMYLGDEFLKKESVAEAIDKANEFLKDNGIDRDTLNDMVVSALMKNAEEICNRTVTYESGKYSKSDRNLDKILTGKLIGYPVMIALLLLVFWLTISGANYPSEILSRILFAFQDKLTELFTALNTPEWLHGILVLGMYRVLAWVISVMLPPMAIFFPLFTLLEDAGYLPRIAYNLDNAFKKCSACGKQALTMCMGFGCNAAGIVGCRIIDSPRERLIAMLTNNFVPCNGRFPSIIAIISMFFVTTANSKTASFFSALILTGVIVFGVFMTLLMSKLLSKTLLKGVPSSFTLELPPYRMPQVGKVIVRSVFDRTLFVLGRAACIAAPAGLIIWLMANVHAGEITLLAKCAGFLDPFARLLGLDGIILMAFILGIPANEIVVPIMVMAYMAQGTITELNDLNLLKSLFVENGWTWVTAVSTILFSLIHWPCSTTLMSIKKESGSIKWAIAAFLIPTVSGMIICFAFTQIANLFI